MDTQCPFFYKCHNTGDKCYPYKIAEPKCFNAKRTTKPIAISSESSLLLDDIEAKIACNEMSAAQVFIQMSQLVADGITRGRINAMEIMTAKEAASLDSMILLDCPFCGKTPVLIKKEDSYGKHYDVACGTDNCYLREGADYWLPAQDVIDLWNTRATAHTREDEDGEEI